MSDIGFAMKFVLTLAFLLNPILSPGAQQCSSSADCKLVYSNCSCTSVPQGDQRSPDDLFGNIHNREICKMNLCRAAQNQASCEKHKCCQAVEFDVWSKRYGFDSLTKSELVSKLRAEKIDNWFYKEKSQEVYRCP